MEMERERKGLETRGHGGKSFWREGKEGLAASERLRERERERERERWEVDSLHTEL